MTDVDIRSRIGKLITEGFDVNNRRGSKNKAINDLFRLGFEKFDQEGPRKVDALMLQQIMWRVMDKTKPLDFRLQSNRPPEMEQLATYGLSTLADRSGLIQNLRGKQGVYWNSYLYGDGFYMWGTQSNEDIPITFNVVPNSNIYIDQFATNIRATRGRSATHVLVIFSMPTKMAHAVFPKAKRMKTRAPSGMIPRNINSIANIETGRDNIQSWKIVDKMTEVGYEFYIGEEDYPCFSIIMGQQMEIMEKHENKDYPYTLDGENYIPVGQRLCMPSAEGVYNYGIGDLFFQLALLSRKLINLAMGHAEETVYPMALVSIAQGTADDFFAKLALANEGRGQGKKPVVPMEYNPADPNGNKVGVQTLATQSAMAEFQTMYDIITKEVERCGIILDDPGASADATQYQILSDEDRSTAWIKQVQEYNASEWEFLLKVLLDMGGKFIKKTNKSKIYLPAPISVPKDGMKVSVKSGDFTLGDWKDEITQHEYFPNVDSRSGAIPSNLVQTINLQAIMATLQPGDPRLASLQKQYAQLKGISLEDAAQAPGAPGGAPGQAPGQGGQPPPQTPQQGSMVPPLGKQLAPQQVAAALA